MHFIQVGMLGALGALAIPIIIHLMFRQRARPIDLGTLQFLKVVLRDNARRRRLKRWLLLALRMACLALIAFLFARPYMLATEPARGRPPGRDPARPVGQHGTARRAPGRSIRRSPKRGRSWAECRSGNASGSRHVRPQRFTPSPSRPTCARPAIEPTAGGTDYGAAMAWARDLLVRSRKGSRNCTSSPIFSARGSIAARPSSLPADVEVHLRDFGRAFPKNVAVTGVDDRARDPPARRVGLDHRDRVQRLSAADRQVSRRGSTSRPATRSATWTGRSISTAARPRRSRFRSTEMPEGLWRGHVEASADDELPFDDRRFLAFSVAPPARVLLVDGDPGRDPVSSRKPTSSRPRCGSRRRASTMRRSPFDHATVELVGGTRSARSGRKPRPSCWRTSRTSAAPDVKRLGEFVDRGGGLLVFTGDRVRPKGLASSTAAGLGVGEVLGPATATELPWRLERWDAEAPGLPAVRRPRARRPAPAGVHGDHADQARPGCPSAGVVPGRRARARRANQGPGQGPLVHLGMRPRLGRLAARADVSADGPSDARLRMRPGRGGPDPPGDRRRSSGNRASSSPTALSTS